MPCPLSKTKRAPCVSAHWRLKEAERLERELEAKMKEYDYLAALWNEFEPDLISISGLEMGTVKKAGVKCPELLAVNYELKPFNAFVKPAWYADGVRILEELTRLGLESEVSNQTKKILDYQRRKTTQKVNLYEKVQIPGYQEAIPR